MKSFLLLVLSLIAGCEARSAVKGCIEAWTEFTCNISNTTGHCRTIIITSPIGMTVIKNWERNGRINLYHEKKKKNSTLLIKPLKIEDAGKHTCESYNTTIYDAKLESKYEEDVCPKPFNQTAYTTAKTTITCHHNKSRVRFFYKEKGDICEETRSNGRFTLTATNSSFNMSISNVSSEDAGVYWCGLESKDGNQQIALRQIRLEVKKIRNFRRSPMVGETFTYWCDYRSQTAYNYKFICKGEDPSVCERLVSTQHNKMNNGKFSLNDDRQKRNITITVSAVTADDAGTYWCGAKSSDKERSNPFFHRFIMTVGEFDVTGRFEVIITGIVCVAVLLLLLMLVLISILVYKRFSHSKKTRPGATAKDVREGRHQPRVKWKGPSLLGLACAGV
ncbi:polymeric immunoglobulin receptor-like isoform X2 [Seriola aureovittata]|uniref:polymeric immunoglobulin receptor-like isoform X2 n=1 Tax=Seriola aureovittata TaxID=2871759 RepID=UPI0024BE2661|nr:polymeric immunoglobulin receptor-like isoform X2 [Seriola aureovittata]